MTYSTSDTNLVACLMVLGERVISINNSNPKRIEFTFDESDTLDENIEFFEDRELVGNLRDVLDAHKNIKKRIYAIKDLENPL